MQIDHIPAQTRHVRKGAVQNAFKYRVDYVVVNFSKQRKWPRLLSHNALNLWSFWDRNHGGARQKGTGESWFKDQLRSAGLAPKELELLLIAQPSFLGLAFSPVSFWVALKDGQPVVLLAEVNSTFGQRHSYFCANEGFAPIRKGDSLTADKHMHVSPFQNISGSYTFKMDLREDRVHILIHYRGDKGGVFASLEGPRRPARSLSLLWAAVRAPFGAARVLALIHAQAVKLWLKKAPFLKKQPAPTTEVSGRVPSSYS